MVDGVGLGRLEVGVGLKDCEFWAGGICVRFEPQPHIGSPFLCQSNHEASKKNKQSRTRHSNPMLMLSRECGIELGMSLQENHQLEGFF